MTTSARGVPRRTVLGAGLALGVGSVLSTEPAWAAPTAEDFATMRRQWKSLHVARDYDTEDEQIAAVLATITESAEQAWTSMEKAPDRTYLWEDAQLETDISFAISRSFQRLYAMALGWASPGSGVAGDAAILVDIIAGLDWMVEHYYREDGEIIGNWYEWQISGPMSFNNATLLVHDELTAEQVGAHTRSVANFTPEPTGTAANRALTATVVVGWGVLAADGDVVGSGVDGLAPVLEYATTGDGFYRDGSFIQHDYYPYIGAYGASILEALVPLTTTVAGSPWQVEAPIIYDWIENAIEPFVWHGALMDMVSGRTIARWNEHEHYHGHYVLRSALGLVAAAPPDRVERLRATLKEWLLDDTYDDPAPSNNIPILLQGLALKEDDSVERRGPLELSKVFHHQDRVVHRRSDWAVGLSMRSSRIANFESINDENLRGWLTADGACYLYREGADQFMDGFWATVDHARIPGTTVDVRERDASEGAGTRSPESWAGGACLGDRFTAAGMRFAAQGASLTAHKSWMFFDDEVVALGAGITADDGRPVETIIENRRLKRDAAEMTVDGAARRLGSSGEWPQARWMHLGDHAGYVFPTPERVQFLHESRTGSWSDVTQHPNWELTDPITHDYLTAWVDHGVDPSDATYAYVVLPGASVAETARYSARPPIEIIANTTSVQAVRHLESGVLAVNFWQPGAASVVSTTRTGSVVLRRDGDDLELAIADPTQEATTATVTVDVTAREVVSVDDEMTVINLDPLTIEVDLSGSGGATRSAHLTL